MFGRLILVVMSVTVLAACAQQPGTDPAGAPEPTDEPVVEGQLEESSLVADLSQTYGADADGAPGAADPAGLPAEPGTVQAHWYAAGGARYVIVFAGINLSETDPLCPGSSLEAADGSFKAVTNSPTEQGACPLGYEIDEGAARVCGDTLMYITQIAVGEEGTLFASVEKQAEDGSVNGMSGSVATDGPPPEIDIERTEYTLPDSLGGGQIACDAA
jgi:hypothetical protein